VYEEELTRSEKEQEQLSRAEAEAMIDVGARLGDQVLARSGMQIPDKVSFTLHEVKQILGMNAEIHTWGYMFIAPTSLLRPWTALRQSTVGRGFSSKHLRFFFGIKHMAHHEGMDVSRIRKKLQEEVKELQAMIEEGGRLGDQALMSSGVEIPDGRYFAQEVSQILDIDLSTICHWEYVFIKPNLPKQWSAMLFRSYSSKHLRFFAGIKHVAFQEGLDVEAIRKKLLEEVKSSKAPLATTEDGSQTK
jgi:hypothetical protein